MYIREETDVQSAVATELANDVSALKSALALENLRLCAKLYYLKRTLAKFEHTAPPARSAPINNK